MHCIATRWNRKRDREREREGEIEERERREINIWQIILRGILNNIQTALPNQ